jgi:hypothetical protein
VRSLRALLGALILAGCKSPPPAGSFDLARAVPDLALAPDLSTVDLTAMPEVKCPAEMAPTGAGGCIDRWEASAGRGKLGAPDGKGTTVVAVSAPGRAPLAKVSVDQAKRACANAGKHLCEEREWVAACRGARGWKYPYGPEFEPRRCNDWDASDNGKKGAVPTGSFPKCVTPTGIYDLSNNVGEWMAVQVRFGKFHEVRGGTYNMTIVDSSCGEDDYTAPQETQAPDIGFRCCK